MPATHRLVACAACGRKNRVPGVATGRPRCGSCRADLPWIATATDVDWDDVVDRAPVPVLVDFWAEWCGPCRMVSPALDAVATDHRGRLKLVKVDTDAAPGLARRFDIRGIPTLLVLDAGRVISRRTGAAGAEELGRWVDGVLADGG